MNPEVWAFLAGALSMLGPAFWAGRRIGRLDN
jgi:hypothetical protein